MTFYIQSYNSRQELQRTHPDKINWQCIFQKPRGMTDKNTIRINVLKVLQQKGIPQQPIYQIGDFFWIPIETQAAPAPQVQQPCKCLQYIGDNGPCPRHGNPGHMGHPARG